MGIPYKEMYNDYCSRVSISPKVLIECNNIISAKHGDLSDLPLELSNTIVNMYYNSIIIGGTPGKKDKQGGNNSIYTKHLFKYKLDAFKATKAYQIYVIRLKGKMDVIDHAIQSLRELEASGNMTLYNDVYSKYMDWFKYDISSPWNKSSLRRTIDRYFNRRKVDEYSNLYSQMIDSIE